MGTNASLVDRAKHALLGNYKPPPFVLAKGHGCRLEDVEGKRYLDLCAGIAVVSCGHAHPKLVAAIAAQAGRLMHTSNLFYNDRAIELADELVRRTGFSKVYFANSGAEANESMLKLARRWHFEHGRPERVELVSTINSFHGRTMGALTLTGQPKYHIGMGPLLPGVHHVAYGDLDAMRAVIGPKTAAVIVEPIQAEGGILVGTKEYLHGLRELCDKAGALLLFDEVQTGYGRTGKFLGAEHSGVRPDACSLAKGIAGGFPFAAMCVTEKLSDGLPPGSHATTFGGNPLGAAAALAVLRIFDEEGLVEHAAAMGRYLGERLAGLVSSGLHPAAIEARGEGLLRGIRLAPTVDPLATLARIREHGVLLSIAGGDVLRFTPPLVVTQKELDEGLGIVEEVLRSAPKKEAA